MIQSKSIFILKIKDIFIFHCFNIEICYSISENERSILIFFFKITTFIDKMRNIPSIKKIKGIRKFALCIFSQNIVL